MLFLIIESKRHPGEDSDQDEDEFEDEESPRTANDENEGSYSSQKIFGGASSKVKADDAVEKSDAESDAEMTRAEDSPSNFPVDDPERSYESVANLPSAASAELGAEEPTEDGMAFVLLKPWLDLFLLRSVLSARQTKRAFAIDVMRGTCDSSKIYSS